MGVMDKMVTNAAGNMLGALLPPGVTMEDAFRTMQTFIATAQQFAARVERMEIAIQELQTNVELVTENQCVINGKLDRLFNIVEQTL